MKRSRESSDWIADLVREMEPPAPYVLVKKPKGAPKGRGNFDRWLAKNIRLEVIGEWEQFKLYDGNEVVYSWNGSDYCGCGENFGMWLALQALPLFYRLSQPRGARELPKSFRRPSIKGEIIKEVAARLGQSGGSLAKRNFVGSLTLLVNREIGRRCKQQNCPDSLRRSPEVSEQHVRRVLKAARFAVPSGATAHS